MVNPSVTLSVEEVRKICTKLWQIAHTCGGQQSGYGLVEDQAMMKTQVTADRLAIRLAASVGLDYGDFDFNETTSVPDPSDI